MKTKTKTKAKTKTKTKIKTKTKTKTKTKPKYIGILSKVFLLVISSPTVLLGLELFDVINEEIKTYTNELFLYYDINSQQKNEKQKIIRNIVFNKEKYDKKIYFDLCEKLKYYYKKDLRLLRASIECAS